MPSALPALQDPNHDQLLALFRAGRHHEVLAAAQSLGITPELQPLASQVVAASLFQLGELGQAATLLEALEAVLGNQRDYLSLYGATCRRLGLLQRSEQLLARALQLDPAAVDIRNNYANLLIDLGRDQEAREILEQLLQQQPNFQDARTNLNRLQFRQQAAAQPLKSSPGGLTAAWLPADPLMMAFAEEEVRLASATPAQPSPAGAALAATLPQPDLQAKAAEQLTLATRAVSENNPGFALQLCSQAMVGLGANAGVYVNAADAYIRSQRFREAEICLLHAVVLGGPAISHYINLVTFASMRGDLALAAHYLDQAAGIDPTHPQLAKVRANLAASQSSSQRKAYQFLPHWPEQAPMQAKPA
jgi:tetratricopeptide (TPR) repeat protein